MLTTNTIFGRKPVTRPNMRNPNNNLLGKFIKTTHIKQVGRFVSAKCGVSGAKCSILPRLSNAHTAGAHSFKKPIYIFELIFLCVCLAAFCYGSFSLLLIYCRLVSAGTRRHGCACLFGISLWHFNCILFFNWNNLARKNNIDGVLFYLIAPATAADATLTITSKKSRFIYTLWHVPRQVNEERYFQSSLSHLYAFEISPICSLNSLLNMNYAYETLRAI